jgi:uncharacterized membrane protein YoaK (UPF0700 family)
MTAVTGLADAVSFLSLGHVFTANMTGNIVLLINVSENQRASELNHSIRLPLISIGRGNDVSVHLQTQRALGEMLDLFFSIRPASSETHA